MPDHRQVMPIHPDFLGLVDQHRIIDTIPELVAEKGLDLNRGSIYIPSPA
jgi:hypothetical protein